jgi:hypothetical protein
MRLTEEQVQAIVEHVTSRGCASCCAYFSPSLLGALERGRRELSPGEEDELRVSLLDCGSCPRLLDELLVRDAHR